ncbi:putative Zn(2)-C6 fungal-type domain-containing protein [Seiridium cardinale]|uniref:Zn(2)-C6 fungal-type domain-containing protein n=1 Tax=Seiridium cardinale TaxID=138064 RepID=A0ABR2XYU5_9PEZI
MAFNVALHRKFRRPLTIKGSRRCHYRKVKCSAPLGQPCTGCRSARVDCVAHEKRRRNRGSPRNPSITLPSLLPAHSGGHNQASDTRVAEDVQTERWDTSPTTSVASSTELVYDVIQDATERVDADTDDGDEVDQAAATLSSMQDAGVQRHLVEMLSQEDIDNRVIQKGVRIVYVGQEFSNINYLIRHRARNQAVHHFPANQISRQYTSHHLDTIPKEAFHLPSPAVVDDLLANYFRLVNPGFPILDEETFMRQYRSRDPQDPPSLLVLQAVLLVGSHVSRERPDRDELKSAFFRRAKMLFDARFEWNRDVVVQAALLLTWHSEGVEDVGANSYHWVSVAVRTAFGLGMHRDCGPSTLVPQDRRIWKRLWWILVQFDVLVTLSYGRPQAINLDDADVPLLTPQDFDGLGGNVNADFVVHHAELCAIMSRVLRERFGLHVGASRKCAAIEQADQSLAHWVTNLPSSLRHGPSTGGLPLWPTMLHISYNNFLILLHRPAPRLVTARAVQNEDISICSSAAATLVSLFGNLLAGNELRCVSVFAVNALFTTLIQLSAEMRVKNPVLGANASSKFDSALEVLRSLSEFWLNAEIIQRLFEDSSERLQQELQIGKKTAQSSQDSGLGTDVTDSPANLPESHAHVIQWPQIEAVAQPEGLSNLGPPSEQLDWTYLYWENSGFNYMSPFADIGFCQPT